MKKANYSLINHLLAGITAIFLLCSYSLISQNKETQKRPKYSIVTTGHWNLDYKDFDLDIWKAVEKEYYDKVTSKNDLIMSFAHYNHRYTTDNREFITVTSFESWKAIEEAEARSEELFIEGWPDEDERKAFFKKRNAYYTNFHSDEIYSTIAHAKPYDGDTAEILLVKTSHFIFPEYALTTGTEFMVTFKEYAENVLHKNEFIEGYYPIAHFWGADNTQFLEFYIVNSMADLDKLYEKNDELLDAHWSTDEAKEKMAAWRNKYYTGIHGDALYTLVPELSK